VESDFEGDAMNWNKVLKIAECKVGMCAARDCVNNKDGQCTLEYISISAKGGCAQYQKKEGYTRGQQSFIDRARENLESQKEAMNK